MATTFLSSFTTAAEPPAPHDPAKSETKAVKFNLTMPGNLLTAIDRFIEQNGRYKNRSAFLADLARRDT